MPQQWMQNQCLPFNIHFLPLAPWYKLSLCKRAGADLGAVGAFLFVFFFWVWHSSRFSLVKKVVGISLLASPFSGFTPQVVILEVKPLIAAVFLALIALNARILWSWTCAFRTGRGCSSISYSWRCPSSPVRTSGCGGGCPWCSRTCRRALVRLTSWNLSPKLFSSMACRRYRRFSMFRNESSVSCPCSAQKLTTCL